MLCVCTLDSTYVPGLGDQWEKIELASPSDWLCPSYETGKSTYAKSGEPLVCVSVYSCMSWLCLDSVCYSYFSCQCLAHRHGPVWGTLDGGSVQLLLPGRGREGEGERERKRGGGGGRLYKCICIYMHNNQAILCAYITCSQRSRYRLI